MDASLKKKKKRRWPLAQGLSSYTSNGWRTVTILHEWTHSIWVCHTAPRSAACSCRCDTMDHHHHLDSCCDRWRRNAMKTWVIQILMHTEGKLRFIIWRVFVSLPAEVVAAKPQLQRIRFPSIVDFPPDSRRVPRDTAKAALSNRFGASVGLTIALNTPLTLICSKTHRKKNKR